MTRLPLILSVVALLAVIAVMLRPGADPAPVPEEPDDAEFEEFAAPGLVEMPDRFVQADGATTDAAPVRRIRAGGTDKKIRGRNAFWAEFKWMKEHQAGDGAWSSEYDSRSSPAVTGLVLLSFLGAGETHKRGNNRKVVKNGLRNLKRIQQPDGTFGHPPDADYAANHAIATLAMCEAYLATGSPLFKQSAQQGIDRIAEGEISRVWEILALGSAALAKLKVPEDWQKKAIAWLDSVTNPGTGVAIWSAGGMVPSSAAGQAAAAAFGRILAGEDPKKSEVVKRAMEFAIVSRP
ncbi:MAG: prenyltransferase/squalene oxidase repeat-containing protein, partial [Planctomycetota bacterium]